MMCFSAPSTTIGRSISNGTNKTSRHFGCANGSKIPPPRSLMSAASIEAYGDRFSVCAPSPAAVALSTWDQISGSGIRRALLSSITFKLHFPQKPLFGVVMRQ
jgi:hypothetical protein